MRQTDFDFARELLTQSGLQHEELVSSLEKGLGIVQEPNILAAWLFNYDGEFLRFESDIRRVSE